MENFEKSMDLKIYFYDGNLTFKIISLFFNNQVYEENSGPTLLQVLEKIGIENPIIRRKDHENKNAEAISRFPISWMIDVSMMVFTTQEALEQYELEQ